VSRRRWFLPDTPDVLGKLREQTAVTIEGLEALAAWAGGDGAQAERVRDAEHRADDRKRELRALLTTAFSTPLEPEDLFALSDAIDVVMNNAKDTVREAEVLQAPPDTAIAEMSAGLVEGMRRLDAALEALQLDRTAAATEAADEAVKLQRGVERSYRAASSALVDDGDLRAIAAKRELYRRLSRTSDALVVAAERVWYAVLKRS